MAKGCHLFSRWTPGSITNGQQILGLCRKKVVNERDEEILGFQDQLEYKSAIKPDLVVCLNPLENYILLHECGLHNVPTIGIIDTDANPTWVTYPIPANDDSMRSVSVIAGALGRAGKAGQIARLQAARRGQINYFPTHRLNPPTAGQAQKEREIMEREAQEERAYIDEGEIVEESLKDMEEAGMDGLEGEEGMMDEMLDGGIEGASESGAYARGIDAEAQEIALEEDMPDVYVDSSLVGEGQQDLGGMEGMDGMDGGMDGSSATEDGAAESYTIDRPLSSEEMQQSEGLGAEDDVLDEMDREQFGGNSKNSSKRQGDDGKGDR